MIDIEISDKSIYKKADAFSLFRDTCKKYLGDVQMNFDKFTVVEHDSYIGYISENTIKDFLKEQLPNDGYDVKSWNEHCNMKEIFNAVMKKDYTKAAEVKQYFYDKCDLIIITPEKEIYIDVKTALTKKTPSESWDFLYPVVQANKGGKDGALLAYCVYEGNDQHTIKKVTVAGFIKNEDVKKCRIIHKGEKTPFHTTSQIENFETKIGRDYTSPETFIEEIKNNKI